MAVDFAALMKAERKARAQQRPQAAGGAWSYCLPSGQTRGRLDNSRRVPGAPPCVWHIRDFVTASEEEEILRCVYAAPTNEWVELRGRKLQSLGGAPKLPPEPMLPEPLPPCVQSVCAALVEAGVFPADAPPNHVLLNVYEPGEGIGAHQDGATYAPHVVILSLGSVASFELTPVADDVADDGGQEARSPRTALLLPPRGLLVFGGAAYQQHLHCVPAVRSDAGRPGLVRLDVDEGPSAAVGLPPPPPPPPPPPRGRRVSLTVRRVVHVMDAETAESARLRQTEAPWRQRAALARWLDETADGEAAAARKARDATATTAEVAASPAVGSPSCTWSPDTVVVERTHAASAATGWEKRSRA